jgi:hypothetical protein
MTSGSAEGFPTPPPATAVAAIDQRGREVWGVFNAWCRNPARPYLQALRLLRRRWREIAALTPYPRAKPKITASDSSNKGDLRRSRRPHPEKQSKPGRSGKEEVCALRSSLSRNTIRNTNRLKLTANRQPSRNCAGSTVRPSGLPPSRLSTYPRHTKARRSVKLGNGTQHFDFEWPERLHNTAAEKSKSESYACTIQWVPPLNSKECEYRLAPASRRLLEWGGFSPRTMLTSLMSAGPSKITSDKCCSRK